ncbi:MAG: hypothetical protein U9N34_09750, partial [Candidatus Cloacimonadota bacterium]|nr:hypothetical protein [Candidatus Cloacimonadota bacterium]
LNTFRMVIFSVLLNSWELIGLMNKNQPLKRLQTNHFQGFAYLQNGHLLIPSEWLLFCFTWGNVTECQ